MSHALKAVSLAAIVLLAAGGIALAADPSKAPRKLPTTPTPQTATQMQVLRPDLVPWKKGGAIGITSFNCYKEGETSLPTPALKILFGFKNIGIVKAGPFKVLVKVNGTVWDHLQNPITWAELPPNYEFDWQMDGPVPGPGTYTLWVKVDSEDAVAELNETNNVATATAVCDEPGRRRRRVEPPKLYPKPKIGPPPVEQQNVPPAQTK